MIHVPTELAKKQIPLIGPQMDLGRLLPIFPLNFVRRAPPKQRGDAEGSAPRSLLQPLVCAGQVGEDVGVDPVSPLS